MSSFYVDVLSMLSLHGLYLDRLKLKALDSYGSTVGSFYEWTIYTTILK